VSDTQGYKIVSVSEADWSFLKLCVWKRVAYAYSQLAATENYLDTEIPAYWKAEAEKAEALIKRLEDL
jgi:hypothetical protein